MTETADAGSVSECSLLAALRYIPQLHRFIHAPRNEHFAIGREGQRCHIPGMSFQRLEEGTSANIPEHNIACYIFVVGQRLAIRREGNPKWKPVLKISLKM